MRKIKRKFAGIMIVMAAVLSITMVAYAKSASYTYSNGYVMNYQLYKTTVGTASGVGAITETSNEARAYVSIFGYNSSGDVKNSDLKIQYYYAYLAIPGNGSKTFKSYHSLLDANNKPIGASLILEI